MAKIPNKQEQTKQPQSRKSVLQPSSSLANFFSYISFSSNKHPPMGWSVWEKAGFLIVT